MPTQFLGQSRFCVAELGAAWAVAGQLFPLMLPGMTHNTLGGVLAGLAARALNDGSALDELYDRVRDVAGGRHSVHRWVPSRAKWLARVDSYVDEVAGLGGGVVSMTGCSRVPGHMELFWTDGSERVFQRWWLEGRGWSNVKDWDSS